MLSTENQNIRRVQNKNKSKRRKAKKNLVTGVVLMFKTKIDPKS
jgi:hypothetical protein